MKDDHGINDVDTKVNRVLKFTPPRTTTETPVDTPAAVLEPKEPVLSAASNIEDPAVDESEASRPEEIPSTSLASATSVSTSSADQQADNQDYITETSQKEGVADDDVVVPVLLEIVGAMGLSCGKRRPPPPAEPEHATDGTSRGRVADQADSAAATENDEINRGSVDPYCVVRVSAQNCYRGPRAASGHEQDVALAAAAHTKAHKSVIVHRTHIIENDPDPIWTLPTGSFCLLHLINPVAIEQHDCEHHHHEEDPVQTNPLENLWRASVQVTKQSLKVVRKTARKVVKPFLFFGQAKHRSQEHTVTIEVRFKGQSESSPPMGVVTIPVQRLIAKTADLTAADADDDEDYQDGDDRYEYIIQPTGDSPLRSCATLAIRYRRASASDIQFLREYEKYSRESTLTVPPVIPSSSRLLKRIFNDKQISTRCVATDLDFTDVRKHKWFQQEQKQGRDLVTQFRVLPYPDPCRPVETEWMTRNQIRTEALKPSTRWVSVGDGTAGTIYLEIIGCDNLPNLDMTNIEVITSNRTDPFVSIVFEDNIVRGDVLFDNLTPRWMPWTTRAFAFKVHHPSSLLHIGVLDYDDSPLNNHNPVGRVVIGTANFEPNTTYLLHYQLHHDPRVAEVRFTQRCRCSYCCPAHVYYCC
jgi:C2 domain